MTALTQIGTISAAVFCGILFVLLMGQPALGTLRRLTDWIRARPLRAAVLVPLACLMVGYAGAKPSPPPTPPQPPHEPFVVVVGDYVKYDLEADLGIVIGPYDSKEKVSAKGLPAGLKLVATKQKNKKKSVTNVVYTIEGVATAVRDYSQRPAYAVVTSGGKTTWQPILLSTVAQEVAGLEPLALGASVKTNACEWLPGVTNGWSVSGLPTGLKYTAKAVYSGTGKKRTLKYPAYTVYGKTTKAGLFTITAKKKRGSYYETLKYRVMVEPKAVDETVFPGLADVETTAYEAYSNAVPVKVDKVSGLPAGLTFAAKNVYAYKNAKKKTGKYLKQAAQTIVGTPTKAGTYVVTYTKNVTIGKNKVAKTAQVVWTVLPSPVRPETTFNVSGGVVLNRNAGSSYATSSAATMTFNVTPEATVTASGLPKGLSLKQVADGVWAIAGTATATGTYYVTVTAKLNGNAVTQSVAVKVNAHPLAGSYRGDVIADVGAGAVALTVGSTGKATVSLTEKGVKTSASLSKVTALEENVDDPRVGKWKCVFTLKAYKKTLPQRTLTLVFERKAGEWELPTFKSDASSYCNYGTDVSRARRLWFDRVLSKKEVDARVADGRIPSLPSQLTVVFPNAMCGTGEARVSVPGEVVVASAVYKASTATYTVTGRLPDGKTFSVSSPVIWCGYCNDNPDYDMVSSPDLPVADSSGNVRVLYLTLPVADEEGADFVQSGSCYLQAWGDLLVTYPTDYGVFGGDWAALPTTVSAALGVIPEEGLPLDILWRAAELPGEPVAETPLAFKVVSKKVKENKKTVTKYYASVSADGGASWVTSANPISWSAGRASFSVVLGGFTLTFDLALDKNGNLVGWARKSHTEKDAKGNKKTVVDAVGAATVEKSEP